MVKKYIVQKRNLMGYDTDGNIIEIDKFNYLIKNQNKFFMVFYSEVESFVNMIRKVLESNEDNIVVSDSTIKIEKHRKKGYDEQHNECYLNQYYYMVKKPSRQLVCLEQDLKDILEDFLVLLSNVDSTDNKKSKLKLNKKKE